MEAYKEPVNIYSVIDSGYYNYTAPSNPLTSGLGLSAAIRHGYTVTYYGAPANGNINYTITKQGTNARTAGWNLMGNPYPEPLSWTGLKNANAGVMNATAYLWVPTS